MPAKKTVSGKDFHQAEPLDLRATYHVLREKLWLILLFVITAACVTGAYLYRAPRIYAAKVVLQVEQEEQQVINIQAVQKEDLRSAEFLKTVEQKLQSRALLARVVETNSLARDTRFFPQVGGRVATQDELITKLAGMIEVKLRKGTRLIDISVEHTDPEVTEMLANSLLREFIRQNFEENVTASTEANEFLSGEALGLKHKLEASENALHDYMEKLQTVSLEDRQNIVMQKLRDLSMRVTDANTTRIVQEVAYKRIMSCSNNVEALLTIPAVASDPAVMEINSSILKLETELANLREQYKPKHPKYLEVQSQLEEWKIARARAVLSVPEKIRATYESARAAEQALEEAARVQETAALALNQQTMQYNSLAHDVEADRAIYQSVLNRIKETAITKDLKIENIRVVQPATIPEKPSKPEKLKLMVLGLLAGLAMGVIAALVLNAWDWTLKSVDQAEEYLRLPVVSTIPRFRGPDGQRQLVMAGAEQSAETESFRTLRTALSMLSKKDEERKTFLFTSALPEEGKTFCSLNYALSLANQGLRTLAIDCDLRRPMVEQTITRNNQRACGVTDYLAGRKDFLSLVRSTEFANFSFIPAGGDAPNPAELLAQNGIDGLIEEALRHFDRVVVDSAPIHAVSDTMLMLNQIQTLVLVVRARKTPKHAVLRAVQMLQQAEAPLAGVILNLLPRSRGSGYAYGSYYDYAYRGKYYGNKTGRAKDRAVPTSA
jgi:capsular exopolysaccharide synthesis family protein